MGRLFWKFMLAFGLSLLAVWALMFFVFWVLRVQHLAPVHPSWHQRAEVKIDSVATLIAAGQTDAARALLWRWQRDAEPPTVYVVDANGRDWLDRPVPSQAWRDAANRPMAASLPQPLLRRVRDGPAASVAVFVRDAELRGLDVEPPSEGGKFYLPFVAIALLGLTLSALLAWKVARPIRSLRWALQSVADGRLDTRVSPSMGDRKDEIADLGREFDRMADRLQQLMGAQQRLLHDVSHELRSPLARMQAALGLARQQPERAEVMLGRIDRELGRLDALVGELLTLARLEAGAGPFAREPVDLVEMVASIVEDASFEARAAGRDVRLTAKGEFVADVVAELMYRAFENVIRNAVRHTAEGTCVEVEVSAGAQRLVVVVKDRGPGVPQAQFEAIFQPFRRLGATASEGVGLGLAIARRAVESHGGIITPTLRAEGGLSMQILLTRSGLRLGPASGQPDVRACRSA